MQIRPYVDSDFDQLMTLYDQSELYGGQRDENRDSRVRLQNRIKNDPDAHEKFYDLQELQILNPTYTVKDFRQVIDIVQ